MRALYSLFNVTATWLDRAAAPGGGGVRSDDVVVFMRPDTFLNCPLPLPWQNSPRALHVPRIGSGKEGQTNDRFAMAGPYAAIGWGLRLLFTIVQCRAVLPGLDNAVHAERYLTMAARAARLDVHLDTTMMVRSNALCKHGLASLPSCLPGRIARCQSARTWMHVHLCRSCACAATAPYQSQTGAGRHT